MSRSVESTRLEAIDVARLDAVIKSRRKAEKTIRGGGRMHYDPRVHDYVRYEVIRWQNKDGESSEVVVDPLLVVTLSKIEKGIKDELKGNGTSSELIDFISEEASKTPRIEPDGVLLIEKGNLDSSAA